MSRHTNIRLYTTSDLSRGQSIALLAEQNHYLKNVMRLQAGDKVFVFNGRDGEWQMQVVELGKKSGELRALEKTREQTAAQELMLLFAPIKSGRIDWLVEKATELGVTVLQPVITQHCEVRKINNERLTAHAIEAAEQCERLDIPELREAVNLAELLQDWPHDKKLAVCTERGDAWPIAKYLSGEGASAFLIGPEGGFSGEELALLRSKPYVDAVSLGMRILRADTAACAVLTCWQALCGDWRQMRE